VTPAGALNKPKPPKITHNKGRVAIFRRLSRIAVKVSL